MKLRNVATPKPPGPSRTSGLFLSVLLFSFLVVGCGVPGDPTPPSPPIPIAVRDLSAVQLGDAVLLTFTPPNKSTRGERLTEIPTLQVLRGHLQPDGRPDAKSFRLVDTVPGSLLGRYLAEGHVAYLEPVAAEETRDRPGVTALYQVRTLVSERKPSADSNVVSVTLYPVPARIETVETHESENLIELNWAPPKETSAGGTLPPIAAYHVYRGELDPASSAVAANDLRAAVWKLPLLEIATTAAPEYRDAGFDYGKTYVYIVRTVIAQDGKPLESADSRPVILTPKDIFPPAPPEDVVGAILPGTARAGVIVDLSWAINLETDLAGYRVYRTEQEKERGQLLTRELLPSSAYRDNSALSGHRYWYTVTAVDRAGNESAPSASLLVVVP